MIVLLIAVGGFVAVFLLAVALGRAASQGDEANHRAAEERRRGL